MTESAAQALSQAETAKTGSIQLELFLLSLVSLFCELLIIRWLATEMRIFAYFKNLPLMAAFLGLGLGFIWTDHRRDYFRWSGLALLYLGALLLGAAVLGLTKMSFVDPHQYMLFGIGLGVQWDRLAGLWTSVRTLSIMLATFLLTVFVFVGFGQRMGLLFQKLKPLEAYSINVGGALLGTLLFTVLCWLETSPGVWLIVAGALLLLVSRKPAHFTLVVFGLAYCLWFAPAVARGAYGQNFVETIWSPYYRIDVVRIPVVNNKFPNCFLGYTLYINYDNFQQLVDCSPENLAHFPKPVQQLMYDAFETPFHLLSKAPNKVLILGAGNGSDIAAALRCGVQHIDAVEIDPGIVKIGKMLHPEKPYASSKVDLHIMDGRTFLQRSKSKYDLILFAYVDSHAAFSSLSSLRMDNYLFTEESFKKAAQLLSPDGLLVVRFLSMADWLWDRHAKALAEATNRLPLGYCSNNGNVDVGMLISGPAAHTINYKVEMPPRPVNLATRVPLAVDDWPFLFLPRREIPVVYMLPIFSVLLLAFLFIAKNFKNGARLPLNWQMFFLGMGFMLLEVRAMSDLSLLFGSTWIVNSAVISAVLVVILLANLLSTKLSPKHLVLLGMGTLLSLALSTIINVRDLAQIGLLNAQMAGLIIYLFPLIFASIIFALLFNNSPSPSTALAFNLLGGFIGACLEYLSMWLGIRALGWMAIAIYATVLVIQYKRVSAAQPITQKPS